MLINLNSFCNGAGGTGGGIAEAPKDGKLYGRKDATWSEVPEGAIGIWIPNYIFMPNPETGNDELNIRFPLTEEQKAENIKNLPLLADENAVGYFKRYVESGTIKTYNTYPIVSKTYGVRNDGFSTVSFSYFLIGKWYDDVRMDVATGDITKILRTSYQDKLVSGKNIKTINGQDITGPGNLEFAGGGGSSKELIEFVVPSFDFTQNPITIQYDITPEDKTANIAASTKLIEKINAGETPNVVVRDNRKYSYFTPWKVNVYRGKASIIAMQEMGWQGRNEIVGYNIEADGSVIAYASWNGVDKNGLKTINGNSIIGKGDIVISGGGSSSSALLFYLPEPVMNIENGYITNYAAPLTAEQKSHNLEEIAKYQKDNKVSCFVQYGLYGDPVLVEAEQVKIDAEKLGLSFRYGSNFYFSTSLNVADGDIVSTGYYLEKGQPMLVSGTNIKTINGNSIVGEGNIEISGGAGGGIADAPADGKQYARQDNNWSEIVPEEKPVFYIPDFSWYSGAYEERTPLTEEEKASNLALLEKYKKGTVTGQLTVKKRSPLANDSYENASIRIIPDRFPMISCFDEAVKKIYTIQLDPNTGNITRINESSLLTDRYKYKKIEFPIFDTDTSSYRALKEDQKSSNKANFSSIRYGCPCYIEFQNNSKSTGKYDYTQEHVSVVKLDEEAKRYVVSTDKHTFSVGYADGDVTDIKDVAQGGGIADAPSDGRQYARKDGTWSVVQGGSEKYRLYIPNFIEDKSTGKLVVDSNNYPSKDMETANWDTIQKLNDLGASLAPQDRAALLNKIEIIQTKWNDIGLFRYCTPLSYENPVKDFDPHIFKFILDRSSGEKWYIEFGFTDKGLFTDLVSEKIESVSKKYVDDLVGAANNKLEMI